MIAGQYHCDNGVIPSELPIDYITQVRRRNDRAKSDLRAPCGMPGLRMIKVRVASRLPVWSWQIDQERTCYRKRFGVRVETSVVKDSTRCFRTRHENILGVGSPAPPESHRRIVCDFKHAHSITSIWASAFFIASTSWGLRLAVPSLITILFSLPVK